MDDASTGIPRITTDHGYAGSIFLFSLITVVLSLRLVFVGWRGGVPMHVKYVMECTR